MSACFAILFLGAQRYDYYAKYKNIYKGYSTWVPKEAAKVLINGQKTGGKRYESTLDYNTIKLIFNKTTIYILN